MGRFRGLDSDPGWIKREFAAIRRELRELRAAKALDASTITGTLTVKDGQIVLQDSGGIELARLDATGVRTTGALHVDGPSTLDGTLTATEGIIQSGDFAAGTSGWQLQADGNAEFNDITLRGGIIGNDALANPVSAGVGNNEDTGTFVGDGAVHPGASIDIAVPSEFSQALVLAVATAGTSANGPGGQLSCSVHIQDEFPAHAISDQVPDGGFGSVTAQFARLVTGLSGGTLTCTAYGGANFASDTGSSNTHISAIAMFLR